ncbi:MAG TPA: hypothetical protein VM840_08095 [Actinomycetota bacterium]|jgi:hypothetical protein|nr:hypothetical protein [Actinomycetota bacterium]
MERDRAVRTVILAIGAFLALSGIWAFASPATFYERVASYPPPNMHLIRDIGAFQFGLGATLLVSLVRNDGPLVALVGTAAGSVLHFFSHVIDAGRGGRPTDPLSIGLLTVVVVLAAVWRARSVGRTTPEPGSAPGSPTAD